jgi:hypothetical protein
MSHTLSTRAKLAGILTGLCILFAGTTVLLLAGSRSDQQAPKAAAHAWTTADLVQPTDLIKELDRTGEDKPTVVCVGFPFLYRAGHVPHAVLHGPARTAEGLADLRAWARNLPRTTDIVLYCGCCPLTQCPNVNPAVAALREMGFTKVRVLDLPKNFATDWIGKGYPIEKTASGARE